MGGYPGGGGYGGGGGYRGCRDNEPEISLEDLLENIETMKHSIRDKKVLSSPCRSPRRSSQQRLAELCAIPTPDSNQLQVYTADRL